MTDVPDWTQSVNIQNAEIPVSGPVTIQEGQQGTALLAQGIDLALRLYTLTFQQGQSSVTQVFIPPVNAVGIAVTAFMNAAFAATLTVVIYGGATPQQLATGETGPGGQVTVLLPVPGQDVGNLSVTVTANLANGTGYPQPVAYISALVPSMGAPVMDINGVIISGTTNAIATTLVGSFLIGITAGTVRYLRFVKFQLASPSNTAGEDLFLQGHTSGKKIPPITLVANALAASVDEARILDPPWDLVSLFPGDSQVDVYVYLSIAGTAAAYQVEATP